MPRRKRDGEILATGAVLDLDALQSIPADRASVERYLEETGLTAARATWADLASTGNAALDGERLSPAKSREHVTTALTRPDGTVAPSPAAWCAAHGVELAAFRRALYAEAIVRAYTERDRLALELERARMLPLRIGSRAVRTHTRQPGAPWRDELKRLKASRVLSAEDFDALEKSEPVPLKGDELLVVAGLLAMARREPGFRAFGPASARMGSYTFEARFLVPKPRLEEFCRLLGYTPTKSGTVPGGDRAKVTRALETLTKTPRPIVVRRREREGQQWRETFLVARDLPIRDEGEHYALHASLFDGFFHGALIFDRVPQQWDAARAALRVRNITDAMKQGDVYFRLLALGAVTGRRREFLARRCEELEKDGLSRRAAKRKAVKEWPEHKPPTLAKKIRHETLLANLNLTEWREKQGQTKARETLETVLEFARAVEGCPLTAWEWLGTGKLPAHLELTFATPGLADDPEDDLEEQGELFAATLGPGDPVPGAEQ